MRRIGMKGGKRRKSETSSDADSGENGGGATNESPNSEAGDNVEQQPDETLTPKRTANNKKRSRGRGKRGDDDNASLNASTETTNNENKEDAVSNAEPNEQDASGVEADETRTTTPAAVPAAAPGDEQENGDAGKSGAKKRKREKPKVAASTSQEKEDDEYEVEKIVSHRTIKGRRQFLVRWKGYNEDSDTWEQEKDLNCQKLIDNFLIDEEEKQEEKDAEEKDGEVKTPARSAKKNKKSTEENESNEDEEEVKTPAKQAKKTRKSTGKKNERSTKGKQNQSSKKEDSDDEEEFKEFEVEKILEVHFKKNKGREFLIRWKGFTSADDTWEPEENLHCPELIEKFMDKVKKTKLLDSRELRTNPAHTKRYTLTTHESGRRWSRRNVDKQRTTYYQCDE